MESPVISGHRPRVCVNKQAIGRYISAFSHLPMALLPYGYMYAIYTSVPTLFVDLFSQMVIS